MNNEVSSTKQKQNLLILTGRDWQLSVLLLIIPVSQSQHPRVRTASFKPRMLSNAANRRVSLVHYNAELRHFMAAQTLYLLWHC